MDVTHVARIDAIARQLHAVAKFLDGVHNDVSAEPSPEALDEQAFLATTPEAPRVPVWIARTLRDRLHGGGATELTHWNREDERFRPNKSRRFRAWCETTLKLREAAARAAEARAAEEAAAERERVAAETARRRGRAIVSAVVSTYLRAYIPELAPADFLVDFNIHSVRARKKATNMATRPGLVALARMTRNELQVGFEKWREGTRLLREEERVARARARKVFHIVVHRAVRDGLDGWIAHRNASRAAERTDAALRELDDWWEAAIMAPVRQAEEAEERDKPRGTYFSQALRSSVLVQ